VSDVFGLSGAPTAVSYVYPKDLTPSIQQNALPRRGTCGTWDSLYGHSKSAMGHLNPGRRDLWRYFCEQALAPLLHALRTSRWTSTSNLVDGVLRTSVRGWYTFAHLCFGLLFRALVARISYSTEITSKVIGSGSDEDTRI